MDARATCFSILAAVGLSSVAGCSAEGPTGDLPAEDPAVSEYLGLSMPERGVQVRSLGRPVPGGADVEYCEVAELPGDPSETYTVGAAEFGNGDFSHHLIVTAAAPGSEADENLRDLDIGDSVPCLSAETAFGDGIVSVGGTQTRYSRIDYPAGVGREYHGGQRVVFDYHYYNTSTEPVDARSAFNLHLVDAADVQHLADSFAFSNWLIDTPPGEQRSFVGECRFTQDVRVAGLTRHTHRWGTDYSVWFAGGDRDAEHVFTSVDFQHDVNHTFESPLLMRAGEGFRFECNYDNTQDYRLRFGVNATDEMCILFGLIFDAGSERKAPEQDCDIVYTDAEGIGRPIGEAGFPPPTAEQAALCTTAVAAQTGGESECMTCRCNSCATVLIECGTDTDCSAILACVQAESIDACQSVIDAHSSAIGLLQQMAACLQASDCGAVCDDF
jgi:hypothetical protein